MATKRFPTIRLYEGEDDDIITWLESLGRFKAREIKRVIRMGIGAKTETVSVLAPMPSTVKAQLDPDIFIEAIRCEILPDMRQVMETVLEERSLSVAAPSEEEDVLGDMDFGSLMI